MTAPLAPDPETLTAAQAAFEEHYPDIERRARLQHRKLRADTRDDAAAETIGWVWKAFRRMSLEGRDPVPLLPQMIRYAAGHVRAGKLIGRSESNDVLSRSGREKGGHSVGGLSGADGEAVELRARVPGPAAEAITAMDWRAFLDTLTPKERALADGLVEGYSMAEIAEKRGVSKAAIGDMRNTVARKYEAFGR